MAEVGGLVSRRLRGKAGDEAWRLTRTREQALCEDCERRLRAGRKSRTFKPSRFDVKGA